ncbi:hypothetical protein [Jannaschia sp. R86511]|uniref:hypothetical protein n=1 Tax=Jannaschia sp. R86511 TaxID=3093853 RepID=UPI0036D2EF34
MAAAQGINIVLRGRFNPAIFSPLWLQVNGLISATELENAELGVITAEFVEFSVGSIAIKGTSDALQVGTAAIEDSERSRDIMLGILSQLTHTPVSLMGINRDFHFSVPDAARWHEIGDILAPKEIWNSILNVPGMLSLAVRGERDDALGGSINVQVEPSRAVTPGVYVNVNSHFALVAEAIKISARDQVFKVDPAELQAATPEKNERAREILRDVWEASFNSMDRIAHAVIAVRRRA